MQTEILRRLAIFADLEDSDLESLAVLFRPVTYPANEVLFQGGDLFDAFFVLTSGGVTLSRDEVGKPVQLLARLGPGDTFGELGIFDENTHSILVRTNQETAVLRIAHEPFRRFLDERPALAFRLQIAAAQRRSQNAAATLDSGLERQRDFRIRLDKDVILELETGDRRRVRLENLSIGGLSLRFAPAHWQTGRSVRFRVTHDDAELPVHGRVAWRIDDTIGLAFAKESPDFDLLVWRMLRQLLRSEP